MFLWGFDYNDNSLKEWRKYMKQIEFDVELTTGELYRFTMRHTYYSIAGAFSLFISLGCLVLAGVNFKNFSTSTMIALLIIASLFTIVQPLMLYMKCCAQIKQNKSINAPLHYTIGEESIVVSQKDQEAEVKWYDVRKVVQTKQGIYLYMSPVRAFIFPKAQCIGQFEQISAMITSQMEQYKDYVPEEELEDIEEENNKEDADE